MKILDFARPERHGAAHRQHRKHDLWIAVHGLVSAPSTLLDTAYDAWGESALSVLSTLFG